MNNMEGSFAKNAVKGISSDNPLSAKRITKAMAAGRILGNKKAKEEAPSKPSRPRAVKSERVMPPKTKKEEPQRTGPINVKSERVYPPEEKTGPRALPAGPRALPAPPTKKASKPRKPRDVKYTQPTLPGMRNTRQFKGKNGKD
jgi:hypothetical protein